MAELDTAYNETLNLENSELVFDITTVWNPHKTQIKYMGLVYVTCLYDDSPPQRFNYHVYSSQSKSSTMDPDIKVCSLRPEPFIHQEDKCYISCELNGVNYFTFPISDPSKDYFIRVEITKPKPKEIFGIFYTEKILDERKRREEEGENCSKFDYTPPFPKIIHSTSNKITKNVESLYQLALEERAKDDNKTITITDIDKTDNQTAKEPIPMTNSTTTSTPTTTNNKTYRRRMPLSYLQQFLIPKDEEEKDFVLIPSEN